jgi:hypothetical protein
MKMGIYFLILDTRSLLITCWDKLSGYDRLCSFINVNMLGLLII